MESTQVVYVVVAFLVVVVIARGIRIVPQQNAYIVQRLGKFRAALQPGINYIVPFFDAVAYKHSLKEK